MRITWHLISGQYPPQPGGLSASTWLIAQRLAQTGDEVRVWSTECRQATPAQPGVEVTRLRGNFGPSALQQLSRGLRGGGRVVVQYIPHSLGWKAMNLPFCWWLRHLAHPDLTVIFHEVAFAYKAGQPRRYRLLSAVTRRMAALAAQAASRIFVTIPGWEGLVRSLAPRAATIRRLPVFSNIVVDDQPDSVRAIRKEMSLPEATREARSAGLDGVGLLIGHFSTYSPAIVGLLRHPLIGCLRRHPECHALLLGYGSAAQRAAIIADDPALEPRLHARDGLTDAHLSWHLQACDLMVLPYPDGVSGRRTTVMAALSHGVPVVTTYGRWSEPLWLQSGAVAVAPGGDSTALSAQIEHLIGSPAACTQLTTAGRRLYDQKFDLRHTIAALREAD